LISADLKGRKALVTGGASGIGLAAVELFAGCGAKVAVNHLPDDPQAPAVIERLKGQGLDVIAAPGNVAQAQGAASMVNAALDTLGGLDFLINNAGTPATLEPIDFSDLEAMTEEFWGTILSTNLIGPFRCAKAAAPALRAAKGAIVNTASVAGLGRRGSSLAYGASKAGLINITKGLARALAPDVRVNAVAPGLIQTPWTTPWPDERKQTTIERTLLARLGKPQDIAETMLFLAAGAAYITGETIVVDGGAA
jgi:3-oxoacyl-[acyl-carrier protein] reductase